MKLSHFLVIGLSLSNQMIVAAITQPTYEIAKWFNNKKAAVSVNFDDNLPGQFSTALPIMNAAGVKGTFYVITNTAGTQWSLLQSAIDNGHEVGSHSASHPANLNPPALTEAQIDAELKNSHDAILANLTGQSSLSISWPFGKGGGGSDSVVRRVAKRYYYAARNTTSGTAYGDAYTHYQNAYFSAFGRDYYLQSGGILMTSTTTKINIGTAITEIIKVNGWYSPFYHAVNQVDGYNNVTTEQFQQHMDTIASMNSEIWITPFGNASKYHHERNIGAATLVALSEDATKWTLNLTDNLNNATFNQPLTILLNEPTFVIESISQNSVNIPFTITSGVIKFNAIPDGGSIILLKQNNTGIAHQTDSKSISLLSGKEYYNLEINNSKSVHTSIQVYDTRGKLIKTLNNSPLSAGTHSFTLAKNQFSLGIYILKVNAEKSETFKLLMN